MHPESTWRRSGRRHAESHTCHVLSITCPGEEWICFDPTRDGDTICSEAAKQQGKQQTHQFLALNAVEAKMLFRVADDGSKPGGLVLPSEANAFHGAKIGAAPHRETAAQLRGSAANMNQGVDEPIQVELRRRAQAR